MAAPAHYLADKARCEAVEEVIARIVKAIRTVAEQHSHNAAHWSFMLKVAEELEK